MRIISFLIEIWRKAPLLLLTSAGLFMLSGILEMFSIAAMLPLLLSLLGSQNDAGFAGELVATLGLPELDLVSAMVLVLVLMSARGTVLFMADFIVAKLARDLEADARNSLFQYILGSNWCYLLKFDTGRLTNIVLRETSQYAGAILKLGAFITSIIIAAILIGSSMLVSWQAFSIFVLSVVPYLAVMRIIAWRIRGNAEARIREANKIGAQIGENSAHLKYIKASGMETLMRKTFAKSVQKYAHYFLRITLYKKFIQHFPEVFGVLILGSLVLFAREYLGANPSDIIFFLLLLYRGYIKISQLQTIRANLISQIPSYEACDELIADAARHQEQFHKGEAQDFIKNLKHGLEITNVSFSYDSLSGKKALDNVSISIPPKGIVAFVGRSGAGKTTLGDILLGLIMPDSGRVTINGYVSFDEINLQLWRQNVGYVPQDAFLVSGTIRDNILIGADDKSDENLSRVAKIAHIDTFVDALEYGYDTHGGDFGSRLSGGQKQRIALARALARKPRLLILDEATSALDNQTEQDVQKAITDIAQEIPVVIIAHRLSTIRHADMIYVIEDGRIAETGTYNKLIGQKGLFWALQQASS